MGIEFSHVRATALTAIALCLGAHAGAPADYTVVECQLNDPGGDFISGVDDMTRHHEELRGMCRRARGPGVTRGQPTPRRRAGIIEFRLKRPRAVMERRFSPGRATDRDRSAEVSGELRPLAQTGMDRTGRSDVGRPSPAGRGPSRAEGPGGRAALGPQHEQGHRGAEVRRRDEEHHDGAGRVEATRHTRTREHPVGDEVRRQQEPRERPRGHPPPRTRRRDGFVVPAEHPDADHDHRDEADGGQERDGDVGHAEREEQQREQDRPAYADAVRAAVSFSTAIVDQSAGTLSSIGVERPGRVLGALVRSAVDNALTAADGQSAL